MSAGFRLELFDFEGAEAIQEEARDLGRAHFNPSAVSAGIDLLFNLVRRGDVGRAERLVDEVALGVMQGGGWHGWLWRLRFTQLQAEMAAAQGRHAEAATLARDAIEQSRSKHRAKYEAYARITLGRALAATGKKADALTELHAAAAIAERLGSPALQVLAGGAVVAVEPDEATVVAARAAVSRVVEALSDPSLRERFLRADAVGVIAR
jgi:ATP/maltotriose-dependent transcriptional regulator MalT